MSNVVSTPYPKEPKLLDVYCNEYWTNNFGPLQVVLKDKQGNLSSYPLSWLDEKDIEFKQIQSKISSGSVPNYIFPIGKLVIDGDKYIIKMLKY